MWIFTASRDAARRVALEQRGAHIELMDGVAPAPKGSRLPLQSVLSRLAAAEVNELLVEAGATLCGELIRTQLADELLLYVAPMLLGPQARALAMLPELTSLDASPRFELIDSTRIGPDLRLRLRPRNVV